MLQRIQSVLLFFAALCMLSILFLTMWSKMDVEKSERITITAISQLHEKVDIETGEIYLISEIHTFYIAIIGVLAAAIAFYSIFRYDNRLLQMKLGALNSLIMGSTLGVTIYFVLEAEKMIVPTIRGDYGEGFYAIVGALFLNTLANRFIRRDEKLVRSADRIR